MEILNAVLKVMPALGGLIGSLIELGHSADDAADIVIKDIESRKAEYEREKAADMAALEDKHRGDG